MNSIKSTDYTNAISGYSENQNQKKSNAVNGVVQVSNANHKQQQADMYVSDISSGNSTTDSSFRISAADAYRAAMKYQNRQGMIQVIERVGDGHFHRPIDIPPESEDTT